MKGETGLIVEGAALRSVFAAGVMDGFLGCDFHPFNQYIGVSGGAVNIACFLSGQARLGMDIFHQVAQSSMLTASLLSKSPLSRNLLSKGSLQVDAILASIDLPDTERFRLNNRNFHAVATSVSTGKPVYIRVKKDNLISSMKASVAIPSLATPVDYHGDQLVDGGISDPVPIQAMIDAGCTKIMVIRARHFGYKRSDTWKHKIMRMRMSRYPHLVATMKERVQRHDRVDALIENPPSGIRIHAVYPPASWTTHPFSANAGELDAGYVAGFNQVSDIMKHWLLQGG